MAGYVLIPEGSVAPSKLRTATGAEPAVEAAPPLQVEELPQEPAGETDSQDVVEEPASQTVGETEQPGPSGEPAPARFSLIYESRDRRLCVFETAEGSVQAANALRFA